MKDFAKIYSAPDIGQVLVTIGEDSEGDPAINFEFRTPRGRAVVGIGFVAGDDQAIQAGFDKVDEEMALGLARKTLEDSPLSSLMK